MTERPRFGLPDGLEYSHIKKAPKVDKEVEAEADLEEAEAGEGTLKFKSIADSIEEKNERKTVEREEKIKRLEMRIKQTEKYKKRLLRNLTIEL